MHRYLGFFKYIKCVCLPPHYNVIVKAGIKTIKHKFCFASKNINDVINNTIIQTKHTKLVLSSQFNALKHSKHANNPGL